jgi:N-methylhydantoinase B/oxoprolinase/acetone carboxylase alpha subunit
MTPSHKESSSTNAALRTDPFLLEIIRNHLVTTCREMGIAMMRTSYSPMFNEALDFTCLIFDGKAEMAAQAPYCPAMIGSTVHLIPNAIREIGPDRLRPGDVVFTNDPYRGDCHLPEFCVIKPYFYGDEILAYAVNIAHMTDIGGMVPAAFGDTRNTWQEGIRFPPLKIYENDREVESIFRILISNVRTPKYSYGDMKAMIGSLYLAEKRVDELVQRYGAQVVSQAVEDIKTVSERLMRSEIAQWPDGEYVAEGLIEDDGVVRDRPWKIKTTVVIKGDELIVDFSGSDPQCQGGANQTFGTTASAAYNAVFHMCKTDIPYNHGCYRPIAIVTVPGTFVNASYPASTVGGNSDTHPTTVDIILRAFAQFSDEASAADGGTCGCIGFGGEDPVTGEPYAHLHLEGVGWGGRRLHDGNDAQFVKNGNCANTPVEVAETRYPFLNLVYELEPNAVGHGRHRGGFGTRRIFRFLADGVNVASHTNRHRVRPWGLAGGQDGTNTVLAFRRKGEHEWTRAKEAFGVASYGKFSGITMNEGDEMLFITPSGGGYGEVLERDPRLVCEDVDLGLLTRDTAEKIYGVALTSDGEVDEERTGAERAARPRPGS